MGSDDSQHTSRRQHEGRQVYMGWVVTIPNQPGPVSNSWASLSGMGSDDSQPRHPLPGEAGKSIWDG